MFALLKSKAAVNAINNMVIIFVPLDISMIYV